MRCLVVNGSANPRGHSKAVSEAVSDVFRNEGWAVTSVDVSKMSIAHCMGCGACRGGSPCIIDDDMSVASDYFCESDLVVFVSPIHFSGPSSLTKLFMDRLNRFWLMSSNHERRICCIFCGGSPEPKYSNAVSEFKAMSIGTGSVWYGHLEISGTDMSQTSTSVNLAIDYIRKVIADCSHRRA